jgi:hypothetical protein
MAVIEAQFELPRALVQFITYKARGEIRITAKGLFEGVKLSFWINPARLERFPEPTPEAVLKWIKTKRRNLQGHIYIASCILGPDQSPRKAVIISKHDNGLIMKSAFDLDPAWLTWEVKRLGYEMTSAEKENLACFSCDEVLKAKDGSLYYHQEYMIRTLTESLNLSRNRDREAGNPGLGTGVFLPKITIEPTE